VYNLGNIIFTDSSISVCGDIKKVYKEEGCGCSDDEVWNYYAYIISEDKETHNVNITKEKYDSFISTNGGNFCGEKTRKDYFWRLTFSILLSIVLLIWSCNIFINDSWTYKKS
jgi:hypothetical protein